MKPAAERLSSWLGGRPAYRVPVLVRFNDSRQCATVAEVRLSVVARSVVEAVNHVRDEMRHIPETEVIGYGPKGGKVQRYVGWYSAIGAGLIDRPDSGPTQAGLPFIFEVQS